MGDTAAVARRYADSIVTTAQKIEGIDLFYTVDSLAWVDHLLATFRDEGHSPDAIEQTLIGLGCYLGEVIIQTLGGRWVAGSEVGSPFEDVPAVVVMDNGGVHNPIGKVFKALEFGPEDNVLFFYEVVQHLAAQENQRLDSPS